MTKTRNCKKCKKELTQKQIWNHRQYCSRECFADARWGEKIQYENLESRRPLVIEAAKLCQAGFTQKAAAEMLGIHPRMVSDWIEQYGSDNFLPGRVCEYCQKSLSGMKYLSNRKYCSRLCASKASYWRTHKPSGRMKFDPELRARGLELYWGGLSQTSIAEYLGVANGTVCSWIHDFGSLRECRPTKEILRLRPAEERLKNAENAAEWTEALRDLGSNNERHGKRVYICCGGIRGNCGINMLVTTITDRLRADPLCGDIFAFCDSGGNRISTIYWDGEIFRIGKYHKTHGGFIWPRDEFGLMVEVCESELETILKYHKKRGELGRKPLKNNTFYDTMNI